MSITREISRFSGAIKDTQIPVEVGLSDNVSDWESHVISLFMDNDRRSIEDQNNPVGSLEHIWQVKLVAGEIVDSAVNCADYDCDRSKAEIYALSHDVGRVHNHPLHHHIGSLMFGDAVREKKLELINANGNYDSVAAQVNTLRQRRGFASAHHFWGMGDPKMNFYTRVQDSAYFNENGHFSEWNEEGINGLLEEIDEQFGLPGIAANLADISKTYPDISTYEKAQQPKLNPVSRGAAELMIQRLVILRAMRKREINNNFDFLQETTYEQLIEEDPEYDADVLGAEFALKLIEFATNRYGIDYEAAVHTAAQKWPQEKEQLKAQWQQNLSAKYAGV